MKKFIVLSALFLIAGGTFAAAPAAKPAVKQVPVPESAKCVVYMNEAHPNAAVMKERIAEMNAILKKEGYSMVKVGKGSGKINKSAFGKDEQARLEIEDPGLLFRTVSAATGMDISSLFPGADKLYSTKVFTSAVFRSGEKSWATASCEVDSPETATAIQLIAMMMTMKTQAELMKSQKPETAAQLAIIKSFKFRTEGKKVLFSGNLPTDAELKLFK